jgi:mannan endo-1,4-beta-mannosidase
MGAKVVRSQTMGDTIGCSLCIEPEEGKFNDAAFQSSDYALYIAAKHHMKVIVTLIGDCAT